MKTTMENWSKSEVRAVIILILAEGNSILKKIMIQREPASVYGRLVTIKHECVRGEVCTNRVGQVFKIRTDKNIEDLGRSLFCP